MTIAQVRTVCSHIPNVITLIRACLVPLFVVATLAGAGPWPVILYAVAASTDWLDGYLARKVYGTTPFGAFLDPLVDKTLSLSAFILLLFLGPVPLWFVAIVFAREATVTVARSAFKARPASNAGKLKATLQNILIIGVLAGIAVAQTPVAFGLVALVTILSGIEFFVPVPFIERRRH